MASRRCRRFFGLAKCPKTHACFATASTRDTSCKSLFPYSRSGVVLGRRGNQNASEAKKTPPLIPPTSSARSRAPLSMRIAPKIGASAAHTLDVSAAVRTPRVVELPCGQGGEQGSSDGDAWHFSAALRQHDAAPQKANQFRPSPPPRGGSGLLYLRHSASLRRLRTAQHLRRASRLPWTRYCAAPRFLHPKSQQQHFASSQQQWARRTETAA